MIYDDQQRDDPDFNPGPPDSRECLIKFWQRSQEALSKFWQVWKSEYFPSLHERFERKHKNTKGAKLTPPQLGEIVLLSDENKRSEWKLGRIVGLKTSKDNKIRVAQVKIANQHILTRPLNEIYSLEIRSNIESNENEFAETSNEPAAEIDNTMPEDMVINPNESHDSFNGNNADTSRSNDRYNLRKNPRKKRTFAFYVNIITFLSRLVFFICYTPICSGVNNLTCTIGCTQTGVAILSSPEYDKSLLCCTTQSECMKLKHSNNIEIQIPPPRACHLTCYDFDNDHNLRDSQATAINCSSGTIHETQQNDSSHTGQIIAAVVILFAIILVCTLTASIFIKKRRRTRLLKSEQTIFAPPIQAYQTSSLTESESSFDDLPATHNHNDEWKTKVQNMENEAKKFKAALAATKEANKKVKKRLYDFTHSRSIEESSDRFTEIPLTSPKGWKEKKAKLKAEAQAAMEKRWNIKAFNNNILGTSTFVSIIFIIISNFGTITGLPCVNFDRNEAQLIDIDECVPQGYAVYDTHNELCERQIKCPPNHHLRFFPDRRQECGEECRCPEWARETGGCSFFESLAVVNSTGSAETHELLRPLMPKTCSIGKKTPQCDPNPVNTKLIRVQLYDDTNLLLSEGSFDFKLTPEPKCIGGGGIKTTGTIEYCDTNQCNNEASKHCRYNVNEMLYISIGGNSLPIKAYGEVEIPLYGFKQNVSSCNQCKLTCTLQGAKYSIENQVTAIELCSGDFCQKSANPSEQGDFSLPLEILIKSYAVQMTAWINGIRGKKIHISCPAVDVCEAIECQVCWPIMAHPQCANRWTIIFITLLFYMFACGVILLFKFFITIAKITKYIGYIIIAPIGCCHGIIKLSRKSTKFPQEKRYRSKIETQKLLAVALFMLSSTKGDTLTDTRIFRATEEQCAAEKDGTMTCSMNNATVYKLRPRQQTLSMILQDHATRTIGSLDIQLHKPTAECIKRTLNYVRDFEILTYSEKRCQSRGSCTMDFCASLDTNSRVKELALKQRATGYNFCTERPGGINGGCIPFVKACLFYRLYASEINDHLYEIFDCLRWDNKIQVDITLNTAGESYKQNLILNHGLTTEWKNVRLSYSTSTLETIRIVDKFMSDGKRFSLLPDELERALIFRCGNRTREFDDCKFPPSICTCLPVTSTVNCNCQDGTLAMQHMNSTQFLLPKQQGNAWLTENQRNLIAEIQPEAMELEVSVASLIATGKVDSSHCHAELSSVSGCYACETGASLQAYCYTDFGKTIGTVECNRGSIIFAVHCEPQPLAHNQTIVLNLEHPNIDKSCVMYCPASTVPVRLFGTLSPSIPNTFETSYKYANHSEGMSNLDPNELFLIAKSIGGLVFNFWTYFWKLALIGLVISVLIWCAPWIPLALLRLIIRKIIHRQ